MRKQMIKKLYTLYTVVGDYNEISNNPEHKLVSYSCGKADCVKYHDTFTGWVAEISNNKFKIGFGLKAKTEDRKHNVDIHRYDLECSTWVCNNKPEDYVIKNMAKIIDFYLNANPYYYEIKEDMVSLHIELTGHQYYNSPYESCDNCKTCDGARCDYCNTKYIVEDLANDIEYYSGYYKEKAEAILNENKENYSDIISDILLNYKVDMDWFEKEIAGSSDYKSLLKLINKYEIPYVTYT